jgi:hypothetical protein
MPALTPAHENPDMEDSMSNLLRTATLSAALLAGTAAVQAQTVIVQDPAYAVPTYAAPTYVAPGYVAPAPIVTAPGATVIAPAPAVVAQPAPIYAQTPIVAQPAPMTREIVTEQQVIAPQPAERVQETVIRRETAPQREIRRSARTTPVHLTRTQKREVLRTIRYERTPAPMTRQVTTTASYSVGSVLPPAVQTYALPRQVAYEAPALQGYAYAPVGNRVLLVEPASNVVVDELY